MNNIIRIDREDELIVGNKYFTIIDTQITQSLSEMIFEKFILLEKPYVKEIGEMEIKFIKIAGEKGDGTYSIENVSLVDIGILYNNRTYHNNHRTYAYSEKSYNLLMGMGKKRYHTFREDRDERNAYLVMDKPFCRKKDFILEVRAQRVLTLARSCPEWDEGLRVLFPEIFK